MMKQKERNICDNAGRTAGSINDEIVGCWDNEVTQSLRIEYDDHGIDTDVVSLCDDCADALRDWAGRLGYMVEEV